VADLRALAGNPALSPGTQELLAELSDALSGNANDPAATDGWSDFDLVGTFAREESFRGNLENSSRTSVSTSKRSIYDRLGIPYRRLLTVLEVLQGIFVFVPLLITWTGLQQAAGGYHRMLEDPATAAAARAGNFLELWQTGFGGKLPAPLKFEWVALYTLCAIVLLIAVTVITADLRRREDQREDEEEHRQASGREAVSQQLLAALTRAQLIVNRDRLATPARFATELSTSARSLGALMQQAELTHRATVGLAERYDQTAQQLTQAITALREATENMSVGAAGVQHAANVMDASGQQLREEVRSQVLAAADRLEAATSAAEQELASQRESGRSGLVQLHERLTASLSQVADRVSTATGDLVTAGDTYASAIRLSGEDAADHIGQAYKDAVISATKTMHEAVAVTILSLVDENKVLTETIQRAQASAEDRAAAARHQGEQGIAAMRASSDQVASAAERNESVLGQHSTVLREHADAMQGMAARLTGALESAGTAAAERQETTLDRQSTVMREHAAVVRKMAEQVADALDSAAIATAAARQEEALNQNTTVLQEHANAIHAMASGLESALNSADTAAVGRQQLLLQRQAQALREHASALQETASRLTEALEHSRAGVETEAGAATGTEGGTGTQTEARPVGEPPTAEDWWTTPGPEPES
jgi:hypothetical protein